MLGIDCCKHRAGMLLALPPETISEQSAFEPNAKCRLALVSRRFTSQQQYKAVGVG
jgi:hypothetical protein